MILLLAAALSLSQDTGVVDLTIVENGKPVACRIHLKDAAGKPVKVPGRIAWNDHHVVDGRDLLDLPEGTYTLTVERGPEHESVTRELRFRAGADQSSTVELRRLVDLKA